LSLSVDCDSRHGFHASFIVPEVVKQWEEVSFKLQLSVYTTREFGILEKRFVLLAIERLSTTNELFLCVYVLIRKTYLAYNYIYIPVLLICFILVCNDNSFSN